jgi:hypothetical protein
MDVVSHVVAIQEIYRGSLQYHDSLRHELHVALVNGHVLRRRVEFLARNLVDVDSNVFGRLAKVKSTACRAPWLIVTLATLVLNPAAETETA